MKIVTTFLFLSFIVFSCYQTNNSEINYDEGNPIIGERTKGLTNVYDSINGQLIFVLEDNVLIDCDQSYKDWYEILLYTDIKLEEYEMDSIKKGRKLKYDDNEIGEILADMPSYAAHDGHNAWLRLGGFIHKDKVRPESIVELELAKYCKIVSQSRSLDEYKIFIKSFKLLLNDQIDKYQVYYKYESSVNDPSPTLRVALIFYSQQLVAILHSRPLEIEGANNSDLIRGFKCSIYPNSDKDSLIEIFNQFLSQVG